MTVTDQFNWLEQFPVPVVHHDPYPAQGNETTVTDQIPAGYWKCFLETPYRETPDQFRDTVFEWGLVREWFESNPHLKTTPCWNDLPITEKQGYRDRYRQLDARADVPVTRADGLVTHAALSKIIEDTFVAIKHLNETKGLEYATETDALANFKRRGAELNIEPMKVWGIFAGKHWDAILAYVRTGETLSEGITGRIDDLILYSILLKGLIVEKERRDDAG